MRNLILFFKSNSLEILMSKFRNLLIFNLLLLLVAACETADPPLPGKRVNVLHYDLIASAQPASKKIVLPQEKSNSSWQYSDIGQYSELPLNLSLNTSPKKQFDFNLPNEEGAVIIQDSILYLYSNTTLVAYDFVKKKVLWTTHPVDKNERIDVLGGAMAIYNNVIYLSTGAKDFVAINAKTGAVEWRAKLPNVVKNIPLISNGFVYVTSTDNKISCFNLQGELKWRYNATLYSIINSRLYIATIEYENTLISITTAGDLIILNKFDGRVITEVNITTEAIIGDGTVAKGPIASPVLSNHALYILTGENELIKIDLKNPGIAWRQNFPNAKSFWVSNNTIYILTSNNQIVAVDDIGGELIWISDLGELMPEAKNHSFYGPILAGNELLITEKNGAFFFLSAFDGKLISRYKLDFEIDRMPVIVDKKIFFIGINGKVSVWQ